MFNRNSIARLPGVISGKKGFGAFCERSQGLNRPYLSSCNRKLLLLLRQQARYGSVHL
jgi:hypothetical protein